MAFNDLLQNNQQSTSLTLTSVTSGTIVAGPTLLMSRVGKMTLSAKVVALAETNTITLTAVWEVSDDASTWELARNENNVVPTALGTGTSGSDTAVTRHLSAPHAVYGKRYARCSCLVGVTTGASSDTFSVAYDYVLEPGA
jgi:hypothetical protein